MIMVIFCFLNLFLNNLLVYCFHYIFRRRYWILFFNRFSKSSLKNEQSMRILQIEFALLLNKYALLKTYDIGLENDS